MKRLCIIPCGRKKIWDKEELYGEAFAKDAYIGTFHKLCQAYARLFFSDWTILSAKYGFLLPEDIVPKNYDLGFQHKDHPDLISMELLTQQAQEKGFMNFNEIVVLGGKKYHSIVETAINNQNQFCYPLQGCRGIGDMQQKLKKAVQQGQEINC